MLWNTWEESKQLENTFSIGYKRNYPFNMSANKKVIDETVKI